MLQTDLCREEVRSVASSVSDGGIRRIGLLDHMGYGNLGDAAIQESMIANISKRLPNATFVAFSLRPADTTKRHNIPCHPITWSCPVDTDQGIDAGRWQTRRGKLKSWLKNNRVIHFLAKPVIDLVRELRFCGRSYRIIRGLDVLIISGGGQLGDLWNGPWSHPYTILKFAVLTRLAGKKLYFFNVGAGPLDHWLSRLFVRFAVQLGSYRSFRDEDSQQLIVRLGVKGQSFVYPDPVYALELCELTSPFRGRRSPPVVGINPFGYCDPRVWPRKDVGLYQAYLDKIVQFTNWLLDRGYVVHIFTTEISVDRFSIQDLKSRLHSRVGPSGLVFRGESESVKDVLRKIAECDLIVTSKFHGIIFSHLLHKPVISLSYHRKMDVAMRSAGQSCYNTNVEEFDIEWLTSAFTSIESRSSELHRSFADMVGRRAAILNEQFDNLFLSQSASVSAGSIQYK